MTAQPGKQRDVVDDRPLGLIGPFFVGAAFVLAGKSLDFGLEDPPFDPGGSWLLGDARSQARAFA